MRGKWTEKQRRILEAARDHPLGLVTKPYMPGFEGVAWTRNADRLVKAGLLMPYVHGGYEITSLGLRTIAALSLAHPQPKGEEA